MAMSRLAVESGARVDADVAWVMVGSLSLLTIEVSSRAKHFKNSAVYRLDSPTMVRFKPAVFQHHNPKEFP
jgi:hypothetical protein